MLLELPEELLDRIGDYVSLRCYCAAIAFIRLDRVIVNPALAVVIESPLQVIEAYLPSATCFTFYQRRPTL